MFAILIPAARAQYLEATIPVGGAPSRLLWDPASDRVYCTDDERSLVTIIDGSTNQVVGTVVSNSRTSFLCWNSAENKVYVACPEANQVAVIDGAGDSLLRYIDAAEFPCTMVYDAADDKVYVQCYDNRRIAVIDGASDSVLRYIPMPVYDFTCAVWHPATDLLFCPLDATDSVTVIDCRTDRVLRRVRVGLGPYAGCLNRQNGCVYLVCSQAVYAVDAGGDTAVAAVPAEGEALWSLTLASRQNKLYVGDWNYGDITVIDCGTNVVLAHLALQGKVADMVCDTARGKVYSANSYYGRVDVIAASFDSLIESITVGMDPERLVWNGTDSRLYVADYYSGTVSVIREEGGIEEPEQPAEVRGIAGLSAAPNPARGRAVFSVAGQPQSGKQELAVFDQSGRLVARLAVRATAGNRTSPVWDCRGPGGTPVPGGVYTAVLRGTGRDERVRQTCTFVVLR